MNPHVPTAPKWVILNYSSGQVQEKERGTREQGGPGLRSYICAKWPVSATGPGPLVGPWQPCCFQLSKRKMTPARWDPGLVRGLAQEEDRLCSEPKVALKVGPNAERGCGPGRPESVQAITPLPSAARPRRRPFPRAAVSSFI